MSTAAIAPIEPIIKTVRVRAATARAFQIFTAGDAALTMRSRRNDGWGRLLERYVAAFA